jgi:uncharacterized membrane protein
LLEKPSQIRRAIAVLVVAGGVLLAGFTVFEQPLIGVGAYVVAVSGVVGARYRAEKPVFDERDEAISRDAAKWTLMLLGLGSAGVFPVLTAAWGVGLFEWQPWLVGVALFVAGLYLTYGIFLRVCALEVIGDEKFS